MVVYDYYIERLIMAHLLQINYRLNLLKIQLIELEKLVELKRLDLELGFLNGASNSNLMNHMLNMQNV